MFNGGKYWKVKSMASKEPPEYLSSTRAVSILNSQRINLFMADPSHTSLRFPGLRAGGGNCPKKKQNPNPSPTWKNWFGFVCFGWVLEE